MANNKKSLKQLLSKIKSGKSNEIGNKENKSTVKPIFRERDMRQEAMDIGSHQAKEYFGNNESD